MTIPKPTPWQPIETAPKDGTVVLVRWPNGDVCSVVWSDLYDEWMEGPSSEILDEPYWMQIPKLGVE